MHRLKDGMRRAATLVLSGMLVLGILPKTAYAATPVASPVISSTTETDTYQSLNSRTGMENGIQVDTVDTGNYQINDVARVSDGFLYLGFDNATGNELVRKVDWNGSLLWQNKSFFDMAGTTQIRGAVEVDGRLFIVGYISQTGFICELNPDNGTLIADSTRTFTGRANGAVSNGVDFIYIAGSKGVYSYRISTKTITPPLVERYFSSIAFIPEEQSVVAVCMLMTDPYNNIMLRYTTLPDGSIDAESSFFTPAGTDYIWSVQYMNGYVYATGQEGSYYIRKFSTSGAELGRHLLVSEVTDTSHQDYHYCGLFSNAHSVYFDAAQNKIYFMGTSNYPNREGNPSASGLDTGAVNTPFNTLSVYEFNAGTGNITSEYVRTLELLDLNLHSARGLYVNASGYVNILGTTQQGNASGDTKNRMFSLSALLSNVADDAPKITVPRIIVSYTNMSDGTGLVTNANIKSKLVFNDSRTSDEKLAGSFKLFENIPTTGTGTSDVYFSITDQCGNKTIGKASLIRSTQVTGLTVNGPSALNKTTAAMPTAAYTATVAPASATDQRITWSSSDTDVATIHPETGALTAIGFGTTTITAQSVSNPNVSATLGVTVKNLYDVDVSPVNGATDVALNGTIVITFQEEMNPTPGMVSLNNAALAGPGSWSNGGKTYTIPYTSLAYGTTYTIKAEGFKDIGNDMVTVNESNSFTTIPADAADAKAAAENAAYAAIAQAAVTDETVLQAYVENIAKTAINNSGITVVVNKVSYTPAIAGTSANEYGTNGAYVFTVTVTKGSLTETTAQKTVVITATAYTGVTDINAVAAAKTAIVDGTVSVAFGATQAQKTAAVQTYVNGLLAAVGDAAGVTATVSFDSGNSYTVSLIKGSVTDNKIVSMDVTEAADPDIATVAAAEAAAANAVYPAIPQAAATDESAVQAYINSVAVAAVSNTGVTVTVNKVSYTQALAGTSANANGTNGEFVFTVTVSKGSRTLTTAQRGLTVIAEKYAFLVTVEGGAGSGRFTAGTPVSVMAGTAPSGQVFDKWATVSGVVFDHPENALATFVMPESDVTVTATYKTGVTAPDDSPREIYIPRTITNQSSGVMVVGGDINVNAHLAVSPLAPQQADSSPASVAIREASADGRLIAAYNIKLTGGGFQGEITLSFPVGKAYNGQMVTILHYVNGRTDTYTAVVVNGIATIAVDSLSPFVVLKTGITVPDTEITDPPKTGDATMPIGIILSLMALCAGYVAIRRRKA